MTFVRKVNVQLWLLGIQHPLQGLTTIAIRKGNRNRSNGVKGEKNSPFLSLLPQADKACLICNKTWRLPVKSIKPWSKDDLHNLCCPDGICVSAGRGFADGCWRVWVLSTVMWADVWKAWIKSNFRQNAWKEYTYYGQVWYYISFFLSKEFQELEIIVKTYNNKNDIEYHWTEHKNTAD